MAIRFDPAALKRKYAPAKKVENLLSNRVTLKKTALSFVSDIDVLDKKRITEVALRTVKGYKDRIKADKDQKTEILDDPKQLIQRVQNEVAKQVALGVREKYAGEVYIWGPSSAGTPDPEHQLNYGKKFIVGEGEMPGDRDGCECIALIQVEETKLEL